MSSYRAIIVPVVAGLSTIQGGLPYLLREEKIKTIYSGDIAPTSPLEKNKDKVKDSMIIPTESSWKRKG